MYSSSKMTIIQKINFIREQRYHDLNNWEKEFISDLYENVQDSEEELTRRQIEKVEEIWADLGL